MSDKAKPARKIQHRGIAVTIWKNSGDKGAWYSVTLSRRYKQGNEWKDSSSYDEDDLLLLNELLAEAHGWIRSAVQANRQARREAA